jgi:hypothetical protein
VRPESRTCDIGAVLGHFDVRWVSIMTSRRARAGIAVMMIVLLALPCGSCGPSTSSDGQKTEDQRRDEKRIQELSKKGYDFQEIRSIMRGEEPKPRSKAKAGSGKR